MDELTQEAYLTCILKPLDLYAAQVEKSGTCEGSVHQKIKWFLTSRQRKANPIAQRVYQNVRAVSESLVESSRAHCENAKEISGRSEILAPGMKTVASREDLANHFASPLSEHDFLQAVHRKCIASWRLLESTIAKQFAGGLTGYRIS
ncbi:MAG: hypothetical protein AAF802_02855 [Planctomycetota bacterium]